MYRIMSGVIHIHDGVAPAGVAAEKGVDPLARGFSDRSPIVGSLIGRQRGAKELDMVLVRPGDKPLNAGD
jgi:hypothetical protein